MDIKSKAYREYRKIFHSLQLKNKRAKHKKNSNIRIIITYA